MIIYLDLDLVTLVFNCLRLILIVLLKLIANVAAILLQVQEPSDLPQGISQLI